MDAMVQIIKKPTKRPLEPEIIVVRSKAVERFVSLQLAQKLHVCANVQFFFPNVFLDYFFKKVLLDIPGQSPFDTDKLVWKIMKILPNCIDHPEFKTIYNYLDDFSNDYKLYQLSYRIADVFNQYLIFRPEMVIAWEKGEPGGFQAELWREIIKEETASHRARNSLRFLKTTKAQAANSIPERISLFGIRSLSPFYIELIAHISSFYSLIHIDEKTFTVFP